MTRSSSSQFVGLVFESLETRINPAFFTARTDIGLHQWTNPLAWSDDPAATGIPGPDDSVSVGPGEWDIDLGGGEVVIDRLDTMLSSPTDMGKITLRNGTLRLTSPSLLSNGYTPDGTAPPLVLVLDNSQLVAGAAPGRALGQIVVNSSLQMHGLVAEGVHLSVAGKAIVRGGLFKHETKEDVTLLNFKSVSVAEGGELLTFGTTFNEAMLRVGLSTGSISNHGTIAGEFGGFPGYLYATDMTNHGYVDLSGGARLSGELVNHNELRVSGPVVHVANLTNSEHGVIGVDNRPLDPGYPAIVVAGTAKLDGVAYVEAMGLVPVVARSEPGVADFLSFAKLEGRFRELVTPEPGGMLSTDGLRDTEAGKFLGLDYAPDRVTFSLIDYPVAYPWNITFDPTAETDATGLVVVFGGASGSRFLSLVNSIHLNLGPTDRVGNWDVVTINWSGFTKINEDIQSTTRQVYMQNGYDLGQSLAYWFHNHKVEYSKFHVVGYSMGSWPADGFVDALQAMGIAGASTPGLAHLTLLDSYVPGNTFGDQPTIHGHTLTARVELGDTASFAEHYMDYRDLLGRATDQVLPNAFNVNVQYLDSGFRLGDVLYDPFYGHAWVPAWYDLTANLQNADSAFYSKGWGYPVAPEYAGTSPVHSKYERGDLAYLTSNGVELEIITPAPGPVRTTAVGAGARIFLVGPDGKVVSEFTPFDASFTGQVRTAAADFNGDGVADIVAGTGPGTATRVRVFDGTTLAELFNLAPFESSFTGGVYVAAGDLNGDGSADLVITPDEGGGPRARVFSGKGFGQMADFFGIEDVNFRGGARPAIGDINGDGKADLVVAAGFGGGPRVGVFDGAKLAAEGQLPDQGASRWNTWKPFGDFLAFEPALRNGTFVAIGDLDGDGFGDLIAGGGPGGGPRVTAFGGKGLMSNTQTAFVNFFAGDVNNRGGVRVSVKNLDSDTKADLVVGAGTGGGSRVTGYLATTITTANPTPTFDFDAIAGFTGGVFVG